MANQPTDHDHTKLSRTVSHALRHEPWLYELELDEEGWVGVDNLLAPLRTEDPRWTSLREDDLVAMIARSDKTRHELAGPRNQALYGHSTPQKLLKEPAVPPTVLFHGTSPEVADLIQVDGLRPMRRQYVHLPIDLATAEQVGRRKAPEAVILHVDAGRAHARGIVFYRGNDPVWLADGIPAEFLS